MAEARRVIPDIDFNGKSAKEVAGRSHGADRIRRRGIRASDTLSIQVFNKDMKFLKGWLPKKETESRPASPLRIGPKRGRQKAIMRRLSPG